MIKLLRREANTRISDDDDNTSLHLAAMKGWTSIAKKLIEHKSVPLDINEEGLIPLELAIRNKHNECATFLVKSMAPKR